MKRTDIFPNPYLAASDVPPGGLELTIVSFAIEEVGIDRERKGVLGFREVSKKLILNRINFDSVAGLLGDDTDDWIDGRIGLYTTPVTFRGSTKPAIRVRPAKPVARMTRTSAPRVEDPFFSDEDESATG